MSYPASVRQEWRHKVRFKMRYAVRVVCSRKKGDDCRKRDSRWRNG
jgi:hypothetical protein